MANKSVRNISNHSLHGHCGDTDNGKKKKRHLLKKLISVLIIKFIHTLGKNRMYNDNDDNKNNKNVCITII